jgi:hypothetical protein
MLEPKRALTAALIVLLTCAGGFCAEPEIFRPVDGFPLEIDGNFIYSSPLFADINRDGEEEIVTESSNKLYVLDKRGYNLHGWPVSTKEVCE